MRHLPVRIGARRVPAMIYLLRRRAAGQPKPGYVEMIAAAARDWKLPERYIALGRTLVGVALDRRPRHRRRSNWRERSSAT